MRSQSSHTFRGLTNICVVNGNETTLGVFHTLIPTHTHAHHNQQQSKMIPFPVKCKLPNLGNRLTESSQSLWTPEGPDQPNSHLAYTLSASSRTFHMLINLSTIVSSSEAVAGQKRVIRSATLLNAEARVARIDSGEIGFQEQSGTSQFTMFSK